MVDKRMQVASLALALTLLGTVTSSYATPSDCSDADAKVTELYGELAKKDSDPSSANSILNSVSKEAKLCEDDSDGDKIPDALEKIDEDANKSPEEAFADWEKKVKDWLNRAKNAQKWTCAEMKKVEEKFCSVEVEAHEKPHLDEVKRYAASMEGRIRTKLKGLVDEVSPIAAEKRKLIEIPSISEKVKERYHPLHKRQGKFRGALSSKKFEGSRSAFVMFVINYGKQQHVTMAGKFGCTVADKELPTDRTRPDCFQAEKCTVIEFKPKGRTNSRQLRAYKDKLKRWYQKQIRLPRKKRDISKDHWGPLIKTVEEYCYDKGSRKVRLKSRHEYYSRCTTKYKCE